MDQRTADAVDWLLASKEPAVRHLTRRDLIDDPSDADRDAIPDGPWVRALLEGQQPDGGFGVDHYRKWTGLHWRLVSLVDLDAPAGDPRVALAAETELAWIVEDLDDPPPVIDGQHRSHASIHGNALGAVTRLGLADDPRTGRLADAIVSWQWPDGGWNCDRHADAHRSSFHETGCTAAGLHRYAEATGHAEARAAADRALELILEHRVFRRSGTGGPINPRWMTLVHPSYWHYDVLSALRLIALAGRASDPRASDAIDHLEQRRRDDGRWNAGAPWWRSVGGRTAPEVVDWGRAGQPNEMVTLHALRVLRAAGR
jgi:hypothetical protein